LLRTPVHMSRKAITSIAPGKNLTGERIIAG